MKGSDSLHRIARLGVSMAFCLGGALAAAAESAEPLLDATGSGFLTLAAGKVLGGAGDPATDAGYHCPCLATDYAQGGLYESGPWSLAADSKLGVQGTVALRESRLSLTGQVVARGASNGTANVEWLYASLDVNGAVTVQLGRKRLPILAESEVQDVGYAYPWVHLPPQLYGWEIVNYNGANLRVRRNFGAVAGEVNVFGGSEQVDNSRFEQIYLGRDSLSRVRWPRIVGSEALVNVDGLVLRAVFITSQTQYQYVSSGDAGLSTPTRQRIYGLSASIDRDDWVAFSEFLYIDRHEDYGGDHAQLLAAGRRFGTWLPMLSWSSYRQSTESLDNPPEGHDMRSFLVRRELDGGAAVKLQYDDWRDHSGVGYGYPHGDRRLVTLAYVRVF